MHLNSQIDFCTDDYEFSHHQRPKGYGQWVFRFRCSNGYAFDRTIAKEFKEAKEDALRIARNHGCWQVELLA